LEYNSTHNISVEEEIQEEVFLKSFIPGSLGDVSDPAFEIEDAKRRAAGEESLPETRRDIFHHSVTGLNSDLSTRMEEEEEDCTDESSETDE